MAPAKDISFLFLLCLFFSMQIHARESQFFSKVPSVNTNAQETTVIPNKEETLSKQEQEPTFTPESSTQGSYGLYGHESNRLPPATTLTNVNGAPYTTNPTNVPFQTEFEDDESLNKYLDTNDNSYDNNQRNYNNYYNSKNSYEANQNGLFDTRLTERGRYPSTANQNNYYNGANQYYNVEKQGMSDTRFLENGKYYYDINSENYNPNQYGNSRSGVNSRIWYGNKGYNYHGNNENSFEHNKHSMEGYQNEEEFQQEQDEFVP
ncbi:hypothetical protein F2P56_009694 [Juglans regia]|uniref:Protein E6-like n=2 Tax=Juglans regia TaxID=51240 RepID=A0A2I4DTB4_JUGRE|nr:protein E6-like [Juglans regia]KAF5473049.1 hypothetical protein F2P56_009694 [Juglans regia]